MSIKELRLSPKSPPDKLPAQSSPQTPEMLANRLIIVRHAHREVSERSEDNGLSPKGWRQAHEFAVWFHSEYPTAKPAIFTSPKRRCQETVDPLQAVSVAKVDGLLDEQMPSESQTAFVERVKKALAQLRLAGIATAPVIACSHGDWIPVAIELGWSKSVTLGKGQWIELDWSN